MYWISKNSLSLPAGETPHRCFSNTHWQAKDLLSEGGEIIEPQEAKPLLEVSLVERGPLIAGVESCPSDHFIGRHGVQGDPATVVTAIPPMKHCPANFLQIVGRIIKMSTRKRAHGLCLEDAFLAVPVLDESIAAVDHQRRLGEAQASTTRTSEAQAMDNRPATTGTDRTPAAARNYNFQADSLSLT